MKAVPFIYWEIFALLNFLPQFYRSVATPHFSYCLCGSFAKIFFAKFLKFLFSQKFSSTNISWYVVFIWICSRSATAALVRFCQLVYSGCLWLPLYTLAMNHDRFLNGTKVVLGYYIVVIVVTLGYYGCYMKCYNGVSQSQQLDRI